MLIKEIRNKLLIFIFVYYHNPAMKRTFWILIAALLVFTAVDANAQRWKLRRYEMDIYLGVVSFHGDIGLADRPLANAFNGMRPSIGVIPRFKITESLAVSLDLGYLMYGGKDEPGSITWPCIFIQQPGLSAHGQAGILSPWIQKWADQRDL